MEVANEAGRPSRGVVHVTAKRDCRRDEGLDAVPSERAQSTTDGAHREGAAIGKAHVDTRFFHVPYEVDHLNSGSSSPLKKLEC